MEAKKAKEDWIKVSSKSRPGRHYMFNRATGETKWLPQSQSKELEKDGQPTAEKNKVQETPPRLSVPKPLKTPAQDRLKRLQHAIKLEQTTKVSSKNTSRRTINDVEGKSKRHSDSKEQQENLLSETPSTSKPTKIKQKQNSTKFNTSPIRASKRPHSSVPEVNEIKKHVRDTSCTSSTKHARLQETEKAETSIPIDVQTKRLENDFEMVPSESFLKPSSPLKQPLVTDLQTSALANFSSGIVNKIKEICKLPFRSSKPQETKVENKDQKLSPILQNTTLKPYKKTENKTEPKSSPLQQALKELKEEQRKIEEANLNKSTEASTSPDNSLVQQQTTPKNLNIPCYQRGSANSRLERLRQSLQLQQTPTSSYSIGGNTPLGDTSDSNSNVQSSTSIALNNSTDSLHQIPHNTISDEIEAMDWQPIKEEDTTANLKTDVNASLLKQNDTKSSNINSTKNEPEVMAEIYDTVNENLLRFAAEKQRNSSNNNNKWLKNFYYFVADTNVMLECLAFIEDLTKLKLCDTQGSMLYIPYCVLQELDKLKMRSGCKEGVKTLAVRAIKYLNKKFENKSSHLQAQTAFEERNHLIDVKSADDSIINCCLQAKEQVPNLLLLTEDVNLRNKAICNNILVSTKSDLLSKRYDTASDRAVSS